jgi:endonuclease YncB( thermonuclease family)|tara:strand:- start:708 stop:1028 length:321 start_codon:yes stop_codon:yes gene_type:complete
MQDLLHTYRAKLVRCVDGDTAVFDVDCGFYISHRIYARLSEVNTPERGKPDYKKATLMLENLLAFEADEEGYVIIHTKKTGKYGRWLVDIHNVNKILAEKWPYGKS